MPYASRQPVLVNVANRFVYNFAKDGRLCMLDFDYLGKGWQEIVLKSDAGGAFDNFTVPENLLTPRDNPEMLEKVSSNRNHEDMVELIA